MENSMPSHSAPCAVTSVEQQRVQSDNLRSINLTIDYRNYY